MGKTLTEDVCSGLNGVQPLETIMTQVNAIKATMVLGNNCIPYLPTVKMAVQAMAGNKTAQSQVQSNCKQPGSPDVLDFQNHRLGHDPVQGRRLQWRCQLCYDHRLAIHAGYTKWCRTGALDQVTFYCSGLRPTYVSPYHVA